jgi:hypothetical protein
MGACDFETTNQGRTAQEAFDSAVQQAVEYYGNTGYTGTIAEKDSFVEIEVPIGRDPSAFARKLMDDNVDEISDKWGPAGCVLLESVPVEWCANVREFPFTGTRKWETVYSLVDSLSGMSQASFTRKGDAIKAAKEIALTKGYYVDVVLEKRLVDSSRLVSTVSWIHPQKGVRKNSIVKSHMNTYLFFGWASL